MQTQTNQTNSRFALIDGLRGIAALWVVFMHFQTLILERSTNTFPSIIDAILKQGHIGVNIFFILSGFVIAYSIRKEIITFKFIGNFCLRRSIRLDPPYWCTLLILNGLIIIGTLLFNKGHEYVPSVNDFFLNAFYLQNFVGVKNILPVAWTLCLEIQFYLILVCSLKLIQNINLRLKLVAFDYFSKIGTAFFISLFCISLIETCQLLPSIPGLFLPFWYNFFIGCLLCWILVDFISDWQILVAFCLMGIFSFFENNNEILVTLILSIGLYFCIKFNKLNSFLSSSIFQFFGKISYSIYLIHWPVGIKFISLLAFLSGSYFNKIPTLVLLAASTGICIGASEVFYRFVELPFVKISRKIRLDKDDHQSELSLNRPPISQNN